MRFPYRDSEGQAWNPITCAKPKPLQFCLKRDTIIILESRDLSSISRIMCSLWCMKLARKFTFGKSGKFSVGNSSLSDTIVKDSVYSAWLLRFTERNDVWTLAFLFLQRAKPRMYRSKDAAFWFSNTLQTKIQHNPTCVAYFRWQSGLWQIYGAQHMCLQLLQRQH